MNAWDHIIAPIRAYVDDVIARTGLEPKLEVTLPEALFLLVWAEMSLKRENIVPREAVVSPYVNPLSIGVLVIDGVATFKLERP
jgi:hypothetical protein